MEPAGEGLDAEDHLDGDNNALLLLLPPPSFFTRTGHSFASLTLKNAKINLALEHLVYSGIQLGTIEDIILNPRLEAMDLAFLMQQNPL